MPEDGAGGGPKSGGVARFFLDVGKSLRSGVVGWISAGILAAIVAGGTYYWSQLRDKAKEFEISRTNMSPAEALAEARRSVGSTTLWAVPFQNRDDPTQYIAVWFAAPENEKECEEQPCWEQLGATKVDLLVGNGGVFERVGTPV